MALTPNPVGTGKDWHTGRQHSPVRFPRATFPDSLLIWHPSVSRADEERCSRVVLGGSGK